MWPRFSFSEKLGLGVILFVALPFAAGLLAGVFMFKDAQSRIQHMIEVMMPGQKAVLEIRQAVLLMALFSRDAAFYLGENDVSKFNETKALLDKQSNRIAVLLEKYKAEYTIAGTNGGAGNHLEFTAGLVGEEKEKLALLEGSLNVFLTQMRDPLTGRGDPVLMNAVLNASQELSEVLEEHALAEGEKLYNVAGFYFWVLVALWLAAVSGSAVLVFYFYRRVTHPTAELVEIIRAIAGGERRRIPDYRRKDEIGELFGAVRYLDDSLTKSIAALERDIRERKLAEEDLKKSEERWKSIVDVFPDAIAIHSGGKIVFANPKAAELVRAKAKEFLGKNVVDFVHPAYRDVVTKRVEETLKIKERVDQIEEKFIRLDGQVIDVEVTASHISYEGKEAIMVVFRDITQRKRTEEDLKKFYEAAEAAAEHIFFTDPDGAVLYVNKAGERMTGYTREEIVGNKPSLWGGLMSKEYYQKLWRTIGEEKKVFYGEIMNRRKSGEKYVADLYIAPILDEKDNVKFFVGIERDITKEKAVDRAKTEFVSLASHQLRTPLSAVKWIIEVMMESSPLTKTQKSYLRDIYVSNQRLINLVRDLLNVAKMEAGGIEVKRLAGVDLHALLDSQVELLKHRADDKKVKINVVCAGEPKAEIDPELFAEAVRNILDNAITYAPPKSTVEVIGKSDDGTCIISVYNEGPAIPESEREKIFTRFYRGTAAQRLRPEGSGLGLFIAKSSVEAMGGKIWFESGAEKGVTFFIQFPTGKK